MRRGRKATSPPLPLPLSLYSFSSSSEFISMIPTYKPIYLKAFSAEKGRPPRGGFPPTQCYHYKNVLNCVGQNVVTESLALINTLHHVSITACFVPLQILNMLDTRIAMIALYSARCLTVKLLVECTLLKCYLSVVLYVH